MRKKIIYSSFIPKNYIKDKNYDNLIIMDGDMQHPISSIDDLIKKSNGKYIVQGLRSKTNSSIYRKIFNQFFYFFVNISALW